MWKYLLILIILVGGTSEAFAQPGRGMDSTSRARIHQAREIFLKEKLELTDKEAKAFFPVFREYESKIRRGGKNKKQGREKGDEPALELTEEAAKQRLLTQRKQRQRKLNMRVAAEDAYLKVLPAKKLVKLERAEHEFRQKLLSRLKQRREGGRH
jgi:hypothetical protein